MSADSTSKDSSPIQSDEMYLVRAASYGSDFILYPYVSHVHVTVFEYLFLILDNILHFLWR